MFRALAILASQMMGVFYFETFQSLQLTNIVFNIESKIPYLVYMEKITWEQYLEIKPHLENIFESMANQ